MITLLPKMMAVLNALALLCTVSGFVAIKKQNPTIHKTFMLSAAVISFMFLLAYITYHLNGDPLPYTGGFTQLYYIILISHIILAALVPILVIWTIIKAMKLQLDKHKKIARLTLPIWLYVSITGLIVFYMIHAG